MNVYKLLDIGYVRLKFTWRGLIYHGGQRIYEKLDHALCNEAMRMEFPEACVKVLTHVEFLDHRPIIIT